MYTRNRRKNVPEGCALWPDNLDDSIFYEYKGFVVLKFEEVNGVLSVVSCEPDIDSFNKWIEEHDNDSIFDPMREKNQMLAAVSFARMMLPQAQLSTDDIIVVQALYDVWKDGKYKVGDIRRAFVTDIGEQPWKCRQDHDTSVYPDITPSGSAWRTFWIPFHGTTPETALPWVDPTMAEDMYKSGEYMIWTDGKIYHCTRDTSYGPQEDPDAWEIFNR